MKSKSFLVSLEFANGEEYIGTETSIRKAQHNCVSNALKNTNLMLKTKAILNTTTVVLNELAMKVGKKS